jgi:hypothetical protein
MKRAMLPLTAASRLRAVDAEHPDTALREIALLARDAVSIAYSAGVVDDPRVLVDGLVGKNYPWTLDRLRTIRGRRGVRPGSDPCPTLGPDLGRAPRAARDADRALMQPRRGAASTDTARRSAPRS